MELTEKPRRLVDYMDDEYDWNDDSTDRPLRTMEIDLKKQQIKIFHNETEKGYSVCGGYSVEEVMKHTKTVLDKVYTFRPDKMKIFAKFYHVEITEEESD